MSTNGKWNRSSALTPEQFGLVNVVIVHTIQDAIARFEKAVDGLALSEEQRSEAVHEIITTVTAKLATALEEWKAGQHRGA
jgi:hypothetical protein